MNTVLKVVLGCLLFPSLVSGAEKGKFVHVRIPGNGTLSLAEVEVFSKGKNVARRKKAYQTTTAHGGDAKRAVDGNTSGNWNSGSITHTINDQANQAWEVDLKKNFEIEKISVWNRDGFEGRLNNAEVMILDADRKCIWSSVVAKPGKGATSFDTNQPGNGSSVGQTIAKMKVPVRVLPDSYDVHPVDNRGILNEPLMRRTVAKKLDPIEGLRLAIKDLTLTYGSKYPNGASYLKQLEAISSAKDPKFEILKREALLANPLIDFDKIMLVKRKGLSMPQNWQCNSSIRGKDRKPENELATLKIADGTLTTVYKPAKAKYVGQFDLGFSADKVLFSSIEGNNSWGVFELKVDPESGAMVDSSLRQVNQDMGGDVDNFDAMYLPDGKIIFCSTASFSGVPCVGGSDYVANLYVMDNDGKNVRRLTFDQENCWNPVVLANGRVMFQRWEYTDSAHYFSRVLMTMNPDGTDQKAYYGSNSYWPNTLFFARPVPDSSSKFVAIVGSHHGAKRSGAMVLFDAAKGRVEADGAVQLIGEYGNKVEPIVHDDLGRQYKQHYLTPYPLSDKYFLTSMNQRGGYAICLVDIYNNVVTLKKENGWNLLEPVPFKKQQTPGRIPDRFDPEKKETTVVISDIHFGPGLKNVPKGTAKYLRVYRYEYAPRNAGGHYALAYEGGWDTRTVLGTVPVESDGSVMFKIPANTPVSLQPLDKDGKALQLMRSWLVGMPGETLSCIGCHEDANSAPPVKRMKAMTKAPQNLTPFYGESRGFAYDREVQPVIDKYCVGCHSPEGSKSAQVQTLLKGKMNRFPTGNNADKLYSEAGLPDFSTPNKSYYALHPYVRRNGPEGDYHLLTPLEFHADTSPLIQMLQKGHHNVKLDKEAWDRVITWIDINVPYSGTWSEARGDRKNKIKRRLELRNKYASVDFDPEKVIAPYKKVDNFIMPELDEIQPAPVVDGWPLGSEDKKQGEIKSIDLGDEMELELVKIPAGRFAMGSAVESAMERPVSEISIDKPFWMGAKEVTLEQYRQFDPDYLNGVYDMHFKDQVHRGYYMNHMEFPVIRVTWEKANEYCQWLSKKIGKRVTLPTESQWEWACRAGSDKPFSYGDLDTDFAPYANLGDVTKKALAVKGVNPKPIKNPGRKENYELKDERFNDRSLHLAPVGTYKANAWGLFDMHGNVAEWTRSDYKPYPYSGTEGKAEKKVVRGGSWNDHPARCTSSFRLGFHKWQQLYNTGFRVIIEE